jgi:hypothetical protein
MANGACSFSKWIVVGLIAAAIVAIVMMNKKSSGGSSEGFAFYPDQSKRVESRLFDPNLASLPLAPRALPPGLQSQSLSGTPPDAQIGPSQPVFNPGMQGGQGAVGIMDFSAMGGYAAPERPLGTMTSQQASQMLQTQMNGGTPQLPAVDLPLNNISFESLDPTDPNNLVYNRTVFAGLKRNLGKTDVDHFRGDIEITSPQPGGGAWFNTRPPTQEDVVVGYFTNYLDVQQFQAQKDALFTRSTPVEMIYGGSVAPSAIPGSAYAYL